MNFEVHQLPDNLSRYVESVFYLKDFIPDHSIERVVPTGHVFLIFELDGIVRNTFDNDTLKANNAYEKAWISGVHKNYLSISAHENSEMLVIQFKPYGAYPFFHFDLNRINDKVINTEELFGSELTDLREQLLSQPNSIKKFEQVEKWLNTRFNENKQPPPELLDFYEELKKTPAASFAQLADSYPKTQKHLIDQFKKYVGITPKSSQRILRFNEILHKIHNKEMITWAQVAYQCGFSDQSYFIKEFKHFSGFNPEEFIDQEFDQDDPNFFPLDRRG
ncbi:AraC family transcriptional regulator [Ekhidna sp.]|uniref:AraC family transcriptional regulator n=1 Tax=Ekhidna sp. TaxID=2608089 RepID=UPI003298C94B